MAHASEAGHCNNGGCVRPVYRGRYCFRCWAGVKWTSVIQRIANVNGHCRSYIGTPLGFTRDEFIGWVLSNPPPAELRVPSIDRIETKLGYVPGNLRWLERDKNSARHRMDVPDGFRVCTRCEKTLPLDAEHFTRNASRSPPFGRYCHGCNRIYQQEWRQHHGARI